MRRKPFLLPAYIPQLDGLRALAILAVIAFHGQLDDRQLYIPILGSFGWAGVDLFFVLSGFLITGILLDAKGTSHYFRNFYARRALRIWPLYYALLLVNFVLLPLVSRHMGGLPLFQQRSGWLVYALYLQNLFDGVPIGPMLGATWSLAIEEQFYFVWPLIVFFTRRRLVAVLACVVLLASPVARWVALLYGVSPETIYAATPYRLDGLAFGALVACLVRWEKCDARWFQIGGPIATLAGAGGVALITFAGADRFAWALYSFLALTSVGLLAAALVASQSSLWGRWLRSAPMRYTGRISYCLYLIHAPIFALVGSRRLARNAFRMTSSDVLNSWLVFFIAVAAAYVLATLSWYCFESPILKLRSRFRAEPGSV